MIRTIPELVHDKNKVEDVDTKGEDHAYDDLRYAIMSYVKQSSRRSTQPKKSYVDPIKRIHQKVSLGADKKSLSRPGGKSYTDPINR